MGRTSKKQQVSNQVIAKKCGKIYSVGIYARLSVELCERKNESIETQIEIAKAFINQQNDMVLYDCYTDLGKSGMNFARDGFERMMQDVRKRRIDCIIVKDLSRFGRNHLETGNYIEKIFPFMGVRLIAITDHFDSMNISGQNAAWSMNLKNLVNEMYAKDISVKVKASKKEKWEQGSYTGGLAPYGYQAVWVEGKKHLFVEENTSDIVKMIYDLFLSGKNMKEIILLLYKRRIVRPSIYHKTGKIYAKDEETLVQWSRGTVRMILTNPVYMGCLVQVRTSKSDVKICSRQDMYAQDWSVKEHMHEAIISKKKFFEVATKFRQSSVCSDKSRHSGNVQVEEDIFADILFCGDCGAKMKRITAIKENAFKDWRRMCSYNCPNKDRIDLYQCVTKRITLEALVAIVKEVICQEIFLSVTSIKELVDRNKQEAERIKEECNGMMFAVEKRMDKVRNLEGEQYLKYRMGELDEECFRREKEENNRKIARIEKHRAAIAEKCKDIEMETMKKNHFLQTLGMKNEKTELTAEVVRTLIHRIEVYPDCRVKVIFKFKRKNVLRKHGI